jgi:hypothetical protein
MTYRTAFDIAQAGYKTLPFAATGLAFIVFGVALVVSRRQLPTWWWGRHPRWKSVLPFTFLGFAVLWTVVTFATTFWEYARLKGALLDGRAQVVEGTVTQFKPMPWAGHSDERFCVREKCFSYSNFEVTAGFNNAASHGGPIREGLPVRVTFVGNAIVKLEIAD